MPLTCITLPLLELWGSSANTVESRNMYHHSFSRLDWKKSLESAQECKKVLFYEEYSVYIESRKCYEYSLKKSYESWLPFTYDWAADMISRKSGAQYIKVLEKKSHLAVTEKVRHTLHPHVWKEWGHDTQVGTSAISHGQQHRRETTGLQCHWEQLFSACGETSPPGTYIPVSQHLAQRLLRAREIWNVYLLRAALLLTFESFQLSETVQ